MKKILFLFLLSLPCSAFAQAIIKGIVVDSASFSPLPYVVVQVKGKNQGTTTDSKGNFSIVASPADSLLLSLLGYKRLEFPLFDYEPGLIRLTENPLELKPIIIDDSRLSDNLYDGLFDDQNAALQKAKIPFYYSKARKDKIKAGRWREENLRIQTYMDVVINNPETKSGFMKKYQLSEEAYYAILTRFNEKYYNVMYYLTAAELTSFLNRFFEAEAGK